MVTKEKSNSIAFTFNYSESSKEWLWPQSICKEDIADVITRWVNIHLLSKAINKFLKAIFKKIYIYIGAHRKYLLSTSR